MDVLEYLRHKGILGDDKTIWEVNFSNGKSFNICGLIEEFSKMKLEEQKELDKSSVSGSVCSRCKKQKELEICGGCYWNSVYDL